MFTDGQRVKLKADDERPGTVKERVEYDGRPTDTYVVEWDAGGTTRAHVDDLELIPNRD
jgi:hypothetical protein